MAYVLNKAVGLFLNPLFIGLALMAAGLVFSGFRRRRTGITLGVVAIAWLWVWSSGYWYAAVGVPLEREWSAVRAEDAPKADAIVLLGGGMNAAPAAYPYPDMSDAADRVWHAARLYRAGKAPIVITSGENDRASTVPLLKDLGVPDEAIVVEGKSRNTEENAIFTREKLTGRPGVPAVPKVLLVTSAEHMRRAKLMFEKYAQGLEVIPAAADYTATVRTGRGFDFRDPFPDADVLRRTSDVFREWIGYWGYRLLRR